MSVDKSFDFFRLLIKNQFPEFNIKDYVHVSSWSSIQLLIIINAIDEHYDVLISREEIKNIQNLEDLHQHILERID